MQLDQTDVQTWNVHAIPYIGTQHIESWDWHPSILKSQVSQTVTRLWRHKRNVRPLSISCRCLVLNHALFLVEARFRVGTDSHTFSKTRSVAHDYVKLLQ